ncbi:MAG TPA: hypothetical protein VMY37_14865 [Thermoguttaceae bacterium]|nr:hypothetical protein [Thermoguttaceae bacterium]
MTRKPYWLVGLVLAVATLGASFAWSWPGEGEKKEQERKVTLQQVPAPVKATILKEAGKGKIGEIEEVTRGSEKFYEAEWIRGGKEVEIQVAADGKLLNKEVEEADEDRREREKPKKAGKREKETETERRVTEAEVPKAALTALKKLAEGAEIVEFAEETEHGSTFYEGSWKVASGAKMDVLVTPTGDLVEIELGVAADDVPAAVLAAARKAAGKKAPLAFEKKTMLLYEVKFRKGDRGHELLLTPDGRRAEQEVEKRRADKEDDD